jgi:pSer/pThr/pTyr-binding forkhead associated (FHA) protein
MPRLIVKSDDRVLKDYVVGQMAMIGRRADNTIVIDDPAVSGHHACVFRDGDHDVLRDLESTNGTFVNDKRVSRHQLRNGDVVAIGKHKIVFAEIPDEVPIAEEASNTSMSNPSDTVFLDKKKHQALLALMKEVDAEMAAAADALASAPRTGVLRVLAGETAENEYRLDAETSIIGKSQEAVLRLRGWFKPRVAVAIARSSDGYVATLMGGKTLINGQPLDRRCRLQDGDILEVNGLRVEFRLVA